MGGDHDRLVIKLQTCGLGRKCRSQVTFVNFFACRMVNAIVREDTGYLQDQTATGWAWATWQEWAVSMVRWEQ